MVLILLVPMCISICHKIICGVQSVYMETAVVLLIKVPSVKVFNISAVYDKY
jgi:hypothetical protein